MSKDFDDDSNEYFTSELSDLFEEEIFPEFKEEFGKVRPLTFDEARKYNDLLVNKDLPDWYWTCTAWSTEERGWGNSVAVVSPSGNINNNNYNNSNGVRPFCIADSKSRHEAEIREDTKRKQTSLLEANIKEYQWIGILLQITTICIGLIGKLNLARNLIAALQNFLRWL